MEEQTRFKNDYEELQCLDQNKLITAVRTGRILDGIKTILTVPLGWKEFISMGLPTHIDDEQASCFINLTKLHDSIGYKFEDEFNKLSVKALLNLNHPVMPLALKLSLLSTAKEINSKQKDHLTINPSELTLKEFEHVISLYLRVILFDRGVVKKEESNKPPFPFNL